MNDLSAAVADVNEVVLLDSSVATTIIFLFIIFFYFLIFCFA